jgi:hopanoid biosynthesis associated radical SAM protein HpnJ|uniref:Hopanoid biosynthesis associated radical SAM protein HpnJ n=1 Tax=Desulfobacca acetoxidans TaxID=60893 RepID=A0A7C3WH20_9BACT
MKRTLLLNPPSFQDFDGGAGSRYQATREVTSFWYPTWLCYPAGLIPESRVVDAPPENLTIDQVAALAKDFDLAVLFTTSASFRRDVETIQRLKDENPRLLAGLVGPQVSILAEESLAAAPAVDFVARREFDFTIAEVAQGLPLADIRGLSYRDRGDIRHNPDRPYIKDLDALPFVVDIYRRDLNIEHYNIPYLRYPYVSFYTGRGCPHHCIYCLWPQTFTGRRYRVRSVANVVSEVRRALELFPQAEEIFFDDDTFTANETRAREISLALKPLQCQWSATARVNTGYETLKAMKEGGLRLLVVGFETGDPQVLKNIKKGATLDMGRRFVKWCRELGIQVHGTFMVGLPGESRESIEASIRFACELDPDTIQVSLATPYPGTEFYEFCREKGYLRDQELVQGMTGYQQCVVDYPALAASEIFAAVPRFYRRFYFRPRYMARTLKVMLRDPVERRRLLQEGREFFSFLFKRRQCQQGPAKAGAGGL